MKILQFANPVFNGGFNVTVRRGIKWFGLDNSQIEIEGIGKNYLGQIKQTYLFRCCDIPENLLALEHDPLCTNIDGLVLAMQKVYPNFINREIVTVVEFEIECEMG